MFKYFIFHPDLAPLGPILTSLSAALVSAKARAGAGHKGKLKIGIANPPSVLIIPLPS
jgi:hypothetical protein